MKQEKKKKIIVINKNQNVNLNKYQPIINKYLKNENNNNNNNNNNFMSMTCYNRLEIHENFRINPLQCNDFFLKSIKVSSIDIQQNIPSIYNEIRANTLLVGMNIFQIVKILKIKILNHSFIYGVIANICVNPQIHKETGLLQIECSNKKIFIEAKEISYRIRFINVSYHLIFIIICMVSI